MGDRPIHSRATILCPLQFERSQLVRAGLARFADLECTGPGAAGIRRWFGSHPQTQGPLILAGLAGALHPTIKAGSAWVISRVVAPGFKSYEPTIPHGSTVLATVTTSVFTVLGPILRKTEHAKTGADLVDMESIEFAKTCQERDIPWAIVRGVSDDVQSDVPQDIARWIDDCGRPRRLYILSRMLVKPANFSMARQLARDGRKALSNVAGLIRPMLVPAAM